MFTFKEIKKSILISLWFMFLTFPIMVIKVNTIDNIIEWRWLNMLFIGIASFFLSFLWRYFLEKKQKGNSTENSKPDPKTSAVKQLLKHQKFRNPAIGVLLALIIIFPFITSMYQTNVMITALIYILLGLGLNIVVGLGGLLHLGYIAFYAIGAYSYALLNYHFGLNFWLALPAAAVLSTLFGILIGIPTLRLRGDYLAIVTLAFAEITRLILENWNDFSFGPSGIAKIPRPGFFGIHLSLHQVSIYLYFIMLVLTFFTIFIVRRLENSRLGRTWEAMREDETASQSMGIDITKAKLTAFALGATWAGIAGVVFAAKTTFINPACFTIWESIIVLCIVVLGGMGSIPGIIIGALILVFLPEYLRAFSQYRMLVFGIAMVLMMIFRPEGIIKKVRRHYKFEADPEISKTDNGETQ